MRRDRWLLYAAAFLRSLGTGTVGILIGIYLARLRLGPTEMGWVMGSGLAGNAAMGLLATLRADRFGRRIFLAVLGVLAFAGGLVVATSAHVAVLVVAAFAGMLNGMGRERGAPLILEQAILPGLTVEPARTRVFAWYNVLGDLGHGLGALLATLPSGLRALGGVGEVASLRGTLGICALLSLATVPLSLALSSAVEATGKGAHERVPLTPASRTIVAKVSALFALDSLGGGFLTTAWLSWFFFDHFHASELAIGLLFLGARVVNAASHVAAARIAERIGLVNTMVLTHLPSSLLLLTVLVAPDFRIAALLFLLREGLSQMDVPTRQSYLMAVVRPEERVIVSGVSHLVRLGAWAVAPFAAGYLMLVSVATPFVLGAALKITYDVLLWLSFRKLRPPEEAPITVTAGSRPG